MAICASGLGTAWTVLFSLALPFGGLALTSMAAWWAPSVKRAAVAGLLATAVAAYVAWAAFAGATPPEAVAGPFYALLLAALTSATAWLMYAATRRGILRHAGAMASLLAAVFAVLVAFSLPAC